MDEKMAYGVGGHIIDDMREYQRMADKTAQYPGRLGVTRGDCTGLYYVSLGLNGEAGEFADKIKKSIRDADGHIDSARRVACLNELGDVLWYTFQCMRELGVDIALITGIKDMATLQGAANNARRSGGLYPETLQLCSWTGMFTANLLSSGIPSGDVVRDEVRDSSEFSMLLQGLYFVLESIARCAAELDSNITTVATLNIEKLSDRQQRGKLGGDGDNR